MFYLFSCTALHFRVSSNPKVCANNLLANQLRYLVFIFVKYKRKKKKNLISGLDSILTKMLNYASTCYTFTIIEMLLY